MLRRIGFGAWQSISSCVGSERKSLTLFQKGLSVVVPCRKPNMPGPSVVPAANEYLRKHSFT